MLESCPDGNGLEKRFLRTNNDLETWSVPENELKGRNHGQLAHGVQENDP